MPLLPRELWCLWLALLLDFVLREPPNRFHPVAWMGSAIGRFARWGPRHGRTAPLVWGGLLVLFGGAAAVAVGLALSVAFDNASGQSTWLAEAVVLKFCFAIGALFGAGGQVRSALESGKVEDARQLLSRHLVSRETSQFSPSQVAAATVESLAENTNDSVVAPLFFYCVAGLPGALLYRFVNTCDAMLGYRDERHEWLGKVPARLDDLLNLVPARLTAGLVLAAGAFFRCRAMHAARVWFHDCRTTASPNAGHSMSAAAGVLGVELEKAGSYCLGQGQRPPGAADVSRSIRLLWGTVGLAVVLLSFFLVVRQGLPVDAN